MSNPKVSCTPQEEGILLVDKEKGRTAFYLVKVLRKLTNIKKKIDIGNY